jgi:hypothetical protein
MRPDPNVPYSEWLTEVPPEEAEYYQNIEDYFGRKGGFPWVVRGRDWLTVRSWFEQGIPLTVVYRAIDEFFEKFGREEAPRFLGFVENFVKKHWRLYRAATVGQMAATGWLQQVTPARLAQWLENWAQQLGRSADRARDRGLEETARVLEKRQASLQRIRRQVPAEGPVTAELIEGLEHKLENFQKTLRPGAPPERPGRPSGGMAGPGPAGLLPAPRGISDRAPASAPPGRGRRPAALAGIAIARFFPYPLFA